MKESQYNYIKLFSLKPNDAEKSRSGTELGTTVRFSFRRKKERPRFTHSEHNLSLKCYNFCSVEMVLYFCV